MNQKAKLLFTSSRPVSWINTAFPFAAGYLYFTQTLDLFVVLGFLFFLIPYNLLMYGINDVYDYESDMRNPRKGGVEGAVVPKKYHAFLLRWSYLLPVPFVVALCIMHPNSTWVLLACLFFVIAYSAKGLRFKEIPFLDSITSSLHFVGPLLYALSVVGWPEQAWPIVAAFFLWGIASQSLGAIQDVEADKQAGLSSISTVIGERATVYFSLAAYTGALLCLGLTNTYGVIIMLVGFTYVQNVLLILRAPSISIGARQAWKRFMWINYFVGAVVTMVLLASSLGV